VTAEPFPCRCLPPLLPLRRTWVLSVPDGGRVCCARPWSCCSHIQGMFNRTIRMLSAGIKPLFVFDGKPPQMKGDEVDTGLTHTAIDLLPHTLFRMNHHDDLTSFRIHYNTCGWFMTTICSAREYFCRIVAIVQWIVSGRG
jgi:hypothetical protein